MKYIIALALGFMLGLCFDRRADDTREMHVENFHAGMFDGQVVIAAYDGDKTHTSVFLVPGRKYRLYVNANNRVKGLVEIGDQGD